MNNFSRLVQRFKFALFGPNICAVPTNWTLPTAPYEPSKLERAANVYLITSDVCVTVAIWTSLFWLPFVGRNLWIHADFLRYIKVLGYFYCGYAAALSVRGVARIATPDYRRFIDTCIEAESTKSKTMVDTLMLYGFRYQWPAQFDVRNLDSELLMPRKKLPDRTQGLSSLLAPVFSFLSNTVGVRLVYPGCMSFINSLVLQQRVNAMEKLRFEFNAKRVGLRTREGLFVEAFYIDRRDDMNQENGNTLVICCEGNAGFAESGTCMAPIYRGYSVLAWNHPGFGSSQGLPFPEQELNSMEAVFLYALHELRFAPSDILVFGWSIGGFPVTWVGMTQPNVAGLVLDATFDNLDEISTKALPILGETIPFGVTRTYFDLNNVAQIIQYPGPILIIRRANDEIITTGPVKTRASNRGNFLLIELLKYRYPELFTTSTEAGLNHYLHLDAASQKEYLSSYSLVDEVMLPILQRELRKELISSASLLFPSSLGRTAISDVMKNSLLIYIASKYFAEVPGTHCTTLDPDSFEAPWSEMEILKLSENADGRDNDEPEPRSNGEWEYLHSN